MRRFENHTVLELASVFAGPAVGMFFAELGARVIKIENPHTGGDVTRSWKIPEEHQTQDRSAYFCSVNWGKESIALDLKSAKDRAVIYQMLPKVDFVISSFLPGKAAKMGLDSDYLRSLNPALICGEINGYGHNQQRAAYDAIIQAEAGFTYMNGSPDHISKMPVALMDVLAAHQLKQAMLLAHIQRLNTGKGDTVQVSLIEAGISALVNQASNYLHTGKIAQPIGSDHPNIVPYGTLFETADQQRIVLAVGSDKQFEKLLALLNLKEVPEFKLNADRVQHRERVKEYVGKAIAGWTGKDLLEALASQRIPAGAVHDMKQVFEQPQAQQLLMHEGPFWGVRSFVGQGSGSKLTPPPALDEHKVQILSWINSF